MMRYRRQDPALVTSAVDSSSTSVFTDSAPAADPTDSAASDAGTSEATSLTLSAPSSVPTGATTDSAGSSDTSFTSSGDGGFSSTGGPSTSGGDTSSSGGDSSSSASGSSTSTSTSTTLQPTSTITSFSSSSEASQSTSSGTPTSSPSNSPTSSSVTDSNSNTASLPNSSSSTPDHTVLSTSFSTIITTENGALTTIVSPVATLNVASSSSSGSSKNSGAIAGAVAGVFGVIVICVGFVFCYRWRQKRKVSRAHRLLPTPRSVLLADEDNFDLAADSRQQTQSRGIFGSIIRHRGGEDGYSEARSSTHHGSSHVYDPSSGHMAETSYANVASLASMDSPDLSALDSQPPPRIMRARTSQTGSMFEEMGIWPPPGEGSRLSDPLMAASNVDLTSIVENVMGSRENIRSQGSGSSTPVRPSRLRGGADSEALLAHMDADSRSPTETSHHARTRSHESTISSGQPRSPGFIARDLSEVAYTHEGNHDRSFTYQSSELEMGDNGSASPDSSYDRWPGQSVMHGREWSGSFTSQSALLPHADVSSQQPPSAFRSSSIFTPSAVNRGSLPPGAAPAKTPGYLSYTPPGSPSKLASSKLWSDQAAAATASSSKAVEFVEERRRSRLSQLAISNPDGERDLPDLPLLRESPLPPIPITEHVSHIVGSVKLVDDSHPSRGGTEVSAPDRNGSLISLPSIYSNEEGEEPTSLRGTLEMSRSTTMNPASAGPSRQTTGMLSDNGMARSLSFESAASTTNTTTTTNSTTTFSPTARARLRASQVQVPFPSALSELGRYFNSQSGSSSSSSVMQHQQTPGAERSRDILEEIPPRYDMLRRDSEPNTISLAEREGQITY